MLPTTAAAIRANAITRGLVLTVIAWSVVFAGLLSTNAATADVVVDGGTVVGTLNTRLATQFAWPGGLDQADTTRSRFGTLGARLVRINATTDAKPSVMPAGVTKGDWTFTSLDSLVNDARSAGADVVLTIAYAPQWMWDCTSGTIIDQTFAPFGDYMARLVSYYNVGSLAAEDGRTITNPAGTANRITYWELWNEPDMWTVACPPGGNPNLTMAQYVTMWNAAAVKMLAVDPTIKLVGPTTANAVTGHHPDYLEALMAGATHKPDIVSFHGYGGWVNSQTDQFLFDGPGGGLQTILDGLAQVRSWAPGVPVWITEINVNAAHDQDPTGRPWSAYGAAWGASAFARLARSGADVLFQYQFAHPGGRELSLVNEYTGQPLLPYWRDYYLTQYFPPGTTLVSTSSATPGVEVLAGRAPGSTNLRVLVLNRSVDGPNVVGGHGLPVTVNLHVLNVAGVTSVTERLLDDSAPLDVGPAATAAGNATTLSLTIGGYGAALLEFVTGSPTIATPPTPTPKPTPVPTPTPTPVPTPTPGVPLPFADGFESGTLAAWSVVGTGAATAQNGVASSGTYSAQLTNGAGQIVYLVRTFSTAANDVRASFSLRPTATTTGIIGYGRDQSSNVMRFVFLYDATAQRVCYYPYDGAGRSAELCSAAGSVPVDRWSAIQMHYAGTATGGADLSVNGVAQGSVSGDYSNTAPFARLIIGNEASSATLYVDDVSVTVGP